MKSRLVPAVLTAVMWLGLDAPPAGGTEPASGTLPLSSLREKLRTAGHTLDARDYTAASEALDEILGDDGFKDLTSGERYATFVFATFAARGRQDALAAHEYAIAATSYPEAAAEIWRMRAGLAIEVEDWKDAAASLATLANQWPTELSLFDPETIHYVTASMDKDPQLVKPRLQLINALFTARFTVDYGFQPSYLWSDLAAATLEEKQLDQAKQILARIDEPQVLARMRVDRRFDELVKSNSTAFDVATAAKNRCAQIRKVIHEHPRNLQPIIEYMYAQFAVGEFKENIRLADQTLKSVEHAARNKPPFDDVAEKLNWIYDIKAQSLRALGRFNESLEIQRQATVQSEAGDDKASQAINLGFLLTDQGEPDKALKALEGIDWGGSLSGYGRMQLQHVRLRAYLEQGNREDAETVLAYMRENQKEAADNWQTALLDWGDTDGAAALFIARLQDPQQRGDALWSAQIFPRLPVLPMEAQANARWDALMARQDVLAAIDEVGRREKIPIYNIQ